MVHEEIITPVVGRDEAVALFVIEPLYRSLGHILEPTFLYWGSTAIKKPLLLLRAALLTHHKTHIYLLHPYYTTTKGRSPDKDPWPGLGLIGAAVGATPPRLQPQRLPPCVP